MAASCCETVRPSSDASSTPARCFLSSVATRTMKNSSRLDADDGEKLDALEQRMRSSMRLIEHPLVELEPAELAIAKQFRRRQVSRCGEFC